MKTILVFLLCTLPVFPAISLHKGNCIDKYHHCKEWSDAGYCNIKGYTTYMDLMCSYSCSKCRDHIEVTRASGEEKDDDLQLGSGSDFPTEEISSTADESKEEVSSSSEESSFKKPRPNDAVNPNVIKDNGNKNVKQERYEDANPPGVRNIAMPKDLPDEVNPRSKITKPISQLSHMVQTLKKTIAQSNQANQKAMADLNSSNYESSTDQGDSQTSDKTPANQEASGSAGSASAEEMKDIAGEVRTGSKIFEEDAFESESTSGCSSGYGCYSEPSDQVRQSQDDEVQELESRSKIDIPEPQKQARINGNSAIDSHGEDVNGVAKTTDIDAPTKQEDKAAKVDIDSPKKQDDKTEKVDIDYPKKQDGKTAKVDIDSQKKQEDRTAKVDIDSPKKQDDETEKVDIDSPKKQDDKTEKVDIDSPKKQEDETVKVDIDSPKKQEDETVKVDIDSPKKYKVEKIDVDHDASTNHAVKTSKIDITASQKEAGKSKNIHKNVDQEKIVDKPQNSDITTGSQKEDEKQGSISHNKDQVEAEAIEGNSGSGENAPNTLELQNDQANHKEKNAWNPPEDTASGSGKGFNTATKSREDGGIDKIIKEDEEEEDIDGLKTEVESTEKSNEEPKVVMHGEETLEKNDDDNKSTGKQVNEEVKESGSGSQDTEEDNIEDALYDKDMRKTSPKIEEPKTPKDISSSKAIQNVTIDNNKGDKLKNEPSIKDLTSPKNKERLTSIENLIANGKLKRKPYAETTARAREELPRIENKEADSTFLANKTGKSHRVSVILDQHFYKPYNNEDSMAYEMLALDLKKEVERAVGGQALVSQIKFSEIKKPGKLPSYSRVLASFRFYGDEKNLHKAVMKGLVGDIMVDKAFYQSS